MNKKSEALEKFKRFKSLVEQETHTKLKCFQTDRKGVSSLPTSFKLIARNMVLIDI